MKQQITRLSPHQNGKVWAVMMTLVSLVFFVPIFLASSAFIPAGRGMPTVAIIVLPVVYLVIGYVMTALGCLIYNLVAKLTGGIEYEVQD